MPADTEEGPEPAAMEEDPQPAGTRQEQEPIPAGTEKGPEPAVTEEGRERIVRSVSEERRHDAQRRALEQLQIWKAEYREREGKKKGAARFLQVLIYSQKTLVQ